MIQLVCLNGEVFADHDADTDVPLAAYPAGCRVVPYEGSIAALPLLGDDPLPGQPDLRFTRAAPEVTTPDDLLRYAASARYYRSIAGTKVGGVRYATDEASEAKLGAKQRIFDANAKATISWKGPDGFVTLDLAGFKAAVQGVAAYREACFSAEAKADAGIRDGSVTTMDEVDAIITGGA